MTAMLAHTAAGGADRRSRKLVYLIVYVFPALAAELFGLHQAVDVTPRERGVLVHTAEALLAPFSLATEGWRSALGLVALTTAAFAFAVWPRPWTAVLSAFGMTAWVFVGHAQIGVLLV